MLVLFMTDKNIEDRLLSHYVDVLNQFSAGSNEDKQEYQSIIKQYPQMSDLLDETRRLHQEYNSK